MDRIEDMPFCNYWNLNQTFLIEGVSSEERLTALKDLVIMKNYSTQVFDLKLKH